MSKLKNDEIDAKKYFQKKISAQKGFDVFQFWTQNIRNFWLLM